MTDVAKMSDAELLSALRAPGDPSSMSDDDLRAALGLQSPMRVEINGATGKVPTFLESLKTAAMPELGAFRGLRDVVDAGAQMLVRGANAVGLAPDSEVARVDQIGRDAEQSYQKSRGELAGSVDPLRLFGNVLATAPLTAAAPVGAGMLARTGIGAVTGAGFGALQPVEKPGDNFWSQKLDQAKTGAIAGAIAAPITAGLARIVQPKTSPDVKKLMSEGVTPTPGQVMGGWAKAAEEKLTSVPILGDAIRMGQRRAIGEFDRAAINRSIAPIGAELPKGMVGRDAIKFAGDKLGQYYDDVLAKVGPVPLDQGLQADLTRSLGGLSGTPDKARVFVTELQKQIGERAKNGVLNGKAFKDIESRLGERAAHYRASLDPADKDLGSAFFEAQKAMRAWLQRVAPSGVADDIAKANQGWASFVRVQNAAGMQGADQGVFTAAQLSAGVRRADKSARKGAFARGDALMQDLSDAGKSVLSQSVPDSGTPGRLMAAALASGGLGYVSPAALAAAGAATLPYTGIGQKAVAGLLARRPELAKPLAEGVRAAGAPVLTGSLFGLLSR